MSKKQREYQSEIYTVEVLRHVETGIAESEVWKNDKGEIHRPLRDGPAMVCRLKPSGMVADYSSYWLNNHIVDPSTGVVIPPTHPPRRGKKQRPPEPG